MITILGPTASGKTNLAVNLAYRINGEIISADSRQIYRGMNIGTGKDIEEYKFQNTAIPYHLIDIVDAGYEYSVYEYQRDFLTAYNNITLKDKTPVLCGGTGMYLEAVLKGYKLVKVPENINLRNKLKDKTDEELVNLLASFKSLHNITDTKDRERLVKAIEIAIYYSENPEQTSFPEIKGKIFGICFERNVLKERITGRLHNRLKNGMIEEVKQLLESGITSEKLKYYGLEYKFIAQYIAGELNYSEMSQNLNIAIHQFAKRQMTWFRRMEKNRIKINWINGDLALNEKINIIMNIISSDC